MVHERRELNRSLLMASQEHLCFAILMGPRHEIVLPSLPVFHGENPDMTVIG